MSELISRMNELTDVNGMSKICPGAGPFGDAAPVEQVGRDQPAEQQALRPEEEPHPELGVRDARVRGGVSGGVRGGVGGGGCRDVSQLPPPRGHPARGHRHAVVAVGSADVGPVGLVVAVAVTAVVAARCVGCGGRLEREAVDPAEDDEAADDSEPEVEDDTGGDDRQAERDDDRPVRGAGHVDVRVGGLRRHHFVVGRDLLQAVPLLDLLVLAVPVLVEVCDLDRGVEVVRLRRRGRHPLDRAGVPRIFGGLRAARST